MMSSQSIQSHVEPLFGGKMPLADRTISSKPKTMSDLRSKQTLQYSEACFPCDRREKEVAGFTPPWTNLKAPLLDVRNPVSHLSGMGGQNHIIYRQDSSSSDEGHSSSLHHAAVKQGFTLYTNSPGMSSPAAATSVSGRKHKNGGESLSPPSEKTVYLAIPKPVYGLNPCCRDLGCVIGHRYGVEHGSARIPSAVYEHEWLQNDARYTERGKAQDALLQQRGLQFESSAEALKRISVGTYSPGRARTFPAVIDPNYTYPFTLPHTLFGSLREQSQRLQTSPRGYPSFYPSHPTYEHMTSEVYQEHSPMSKYGRLTQHPMFYYPQANVEVENRTQCKDICSKQREDVPVILKNSISNHREHYMVPQLLHGEIPRPLSEETLHNHSFMRGSDHQAFAPPGLHSNSAQIRELLSSGRINVSPKKPYVYHPGTSAANLHKDKLSTGLPQTHSPFRHVDQTSPPRRTSQPGISPSSVPVNRFIPPLTSLHLHRPILPPTALNSDKLRDHSSFESQVTCPRQARGIPVPPGVWLPQSPPHSSGRIHTPLPGSVQVPKIIYSPAVTPGKKEKHPMPSPSSAVQKGCLKRSFSHSSSPAKIKEEDRELCEVELLKKRQKMKMENLREKNENDPPLMPVIDNVFSLASYQAYLQAPGLLFPGRVSQRIPQQSEHREVKCRPDIKEKKPSQDEQQPAVCLVSKEARADSQKGSVETFELKTIKVEKVDPSDTDNSAEACVSPRDCRHVTIKKEPEDAGSSNREAMLVIKKVNPDKLEGKPSLEEQKETSDESSQSEATAQIKTSDQRDASKMQEQVVTIQPTPNTSPQLENGDKFKNIPPQCLKLSNYKIVFHSTNHSSPVLPPQKLAVQPISEFVPKSEPQTPVRKHFFEMHQSLCKLISRSVLASSMQDLKAWLSQLDLSRPVSPPTKVKKVSCLFGEKARETWLNDDIKLALHKLLERLGEYMAQERCPFPHVMRTGAVFLPMLVVKELLFPTVQGSFIDQVLQEHKVELRPTTLSEEKILIQLHKRACSSRLRRLMSLKHLPDIYADVVSLMYYTCVCKHLESSSPDGQKKVQD
ncbi:uncharacterized protein C15orf39 homolog [Cheilinus undulatus]|uniref:uncharacterized protein C15orf39 homolog n=1 Tax=Cheilinus undulatus TaxID=241271 RepID=UPI001BD4DE4D|nr:uncharacterized protein C15orf39 homolog [Cheilinus undulatus]